MKNILIFLLVILYYSSAFAQNNCQNKPSHIPDEMYRGRYQEADMRYGNPYTMFNKNRVGWTLATEILNIRNKLNLGRKDNNGEFVDEYSIIYKNLYTYDTSTTEPGKCPSDANCDHSKWVKNQAVVYIIGLRYQKINGRDTFTLLTEDERYVFADRARTGLSNLNPLMGAGCAYARLSCSLSYINEI